MNAADEFVVYDNIEFSKKGWVNRNRILVNGKDEYITIPLKKDSDYLDIIERCLAEIWLAERKKLLNRIIESYRKSPNFSSVYPIIAKCFLYESDNLFDFLINSLTSIRDYLEIQTPFVASSSIEVDHTLKSAKKVMAICKARSATAYINPIGGFELYNKSDFGAAEIELHFLETKVISYQQFKNEFVPFLSIIDVMMFNSKGDINKMLHSFNFK
jgi:WbqC-like protein family